MNNALKKALINPWLGSLISFLPIVALLGVMWMYLARPMPTAESVSQMPWWAPLGGLVGAFPVVAGLVFVGKVGAAAFAGLTITSNILMSLVIDKFGLFGMETHASSVGRMAGAAVMVAGIVLISYFSRRPRWMRPNP